MKNKKGKIIVLSVFAVIVYFAGLFSLQDYFIFFPDKDYIAPEAAGVSQFVEKPFTAKDGSEIMGWYFEGDKNKPALLFFHGNAGQIATFAPLMKAYIAEGYPVYMAEYRGFGAVPGKLGQQVMYDDGEAAFDFLQKRLGHQQIIVFGYSMGTAAASATAANRPAAGLILAAPFYSLKDVVGEKPVPGAVWVLKNTLPSYQFVKDFNKPLLVVHGEKDRLIPARHGKRLFELSASEDKEFHLVPEESHNGLYYHPQNHRIILDWLQNR